MEEKLKAYEDMFEESFPTLDFSYLSETGIEAIIDTCLKEKKDVYELGFIENDPNVKY